jgi:hypothetical protein
VKRAAVLSLAAAVAAFGCSAPAPPADGADRLAAAEYARTARRALETTRFGALGDGWLVDLVIEACEALRPSAGGDAAVLEVVDAAAAGVVPPAGAPAPGDAAEDRILLEVVATGMATVCPEEVIAATTVPAAGPEDRYLLVVGTAADEAGMAPGSGLLLDSGRAVCRAMGSGAGPEGGVLAAAAALFGVEAAGLGELEADPRVGVAGGRVLGTLLASAAAYLCPEHGEEVAAYVAGLEG